MTFVCLCALAFVALQAASASSPCSLPYCNTTLPPEQRILSLLSLLTLEEKVGLLTGQGVDRLHIGGLKTGEALHGVVAGCGKDGSRDYCPTSFPAGPALGATRNETLWRLIAEQIATESRALQPVGGSRWAPDINLARDPRWGRAQEVVSEDPHVTSRYVVQFIQGLQEGELYPKYIKVIGTCKHFLAYDVDEGMAQPNNISYNRHSFNAIVPKEDLVDYYLPAWEACIKEGKAGAVMCSYNAVNGTPSCANGPMQNALLRDTWGWGSDFAPPGTKMSQSVLSPSIVSDCHAIGDMAKTCNCSTSHSQYVHPGHGFAVDGEDAVKKALAGGTDSNCGCYFSKYLLSAVKNSKVSPETVDLAAGRILTALLRTGQLDDAGRSSAYTQIPKSEVDSAHARKLALEAAEQSIVLLQNTPVAGSPLLPIVDPPMRVAMIGPHANATDALLSIYHGDNHVVQQHSPLQAAQRAWPEATITHVAGCADTTSQDTAGIAAAAAAASSADVALVFVGLSPCGDNKIPTCNEGESHDRNHNLGGADEGALGLPGAQQQLVEAVAKANPKYVVVLVNGGALSVDWMKAHSPAIVESFYAGEVGGTAIMNVLRGVANPVGTLPWTIYPASFVATRPITAMAMRAGQGITHLYYEGQPLWKFGFGLSYTTFTYKKLNDSADPHLDARQTTTTPTTMTVQVSVTNTGTRAGAHAVQLFVTSSDFEDFPRQRCYHFALTGTLSPGGATTLTMPLPTQKDLAVADKSGKRWLHPAAYTIWVGLPREAGSIQHEMQVLGREPLLISDHLSSAANNGP